MHKLISKQESEIPTMYCTQNIRKLHTFDFTESIYRWKSHFLMKNEETVLFNHIEGSVPSGTKRVLGDKCFSIYIDPKVP